MDEVFSTLANGESFTKIWLAHINRYLRLLFGIASTPATWQKAMATVLQGCKGVVYYLDDMAQQEKSIPGIYAQTAKIWVRLSANFWNSWVMWSLLLGYAQLIKGWTTFFTKL